MSAEGSSAPSWVPRLVGWILGLASFVYLLALPPTLHKLDESYLLHGAKRILHGEALYRDVFDFLTPGSFYLYVVAYAVGGTTLTSARVATALLNAIASTCTYFLALHVASMAEALLAGLLVIAICVPVWNMASHHWIATSLGLAAAAVLLADRWRDSSRGRPAAAGALGGLLVCSDQGRGLWLILWLGITVPALALAHGGPSRWRRVARELLWAASGGAAVCLPLLGYAVWRASPGELLYATHTWVLTSYYRHHVGNMSWNGFSWLWAGGLRFTWPWLFEAIPALLALETAALAWTVWRTGLHAEVVRASILLLAIVTVASILYFPDYVHVAFVAPYFLVVLAGLVHRVRSWLLPARRPSVTAVFRLAWVALLTLVVVKARSNAALAWRDNPVLTETAFGTIASPAVEAETFRDLEERVRNTPAPLRLYAYPADAWLYLVLPADNPTPFESLWLTVHTPEQLQTAIERLERDPAAPVLVNLFMVKRRDPVVAYLRAHYRDVGGVGPPIFGGQPMYRLFVAGRSPPPSARPEGAPARP